jgi:hypothetical protein
MSFPLFHDSGSQIKAVRASDNAALTAGSTGDNTPVVGQIIDRSALGMPLSCAVVIAIKAILGDTNKLTLKSVTIDHGDDSALGDATTFATPADVDVLVDPASPGGGSTMRGQQQYNVDLGGAKRYVRLTFTPDLNAANTDTGECAALWIFGGAPTLPAS